MRVIELDDDVLKELPVDQIIRDQSIAAELIMAGYPRIRDIIDKSPAYMMHEAGLSAGRVKRVQDYLNRYGLSLGGYDMIYRDMNLANGYTVRADSLNSFPFGLGISLIDEDTEEIYKYIFDLNADSEQETLKVMDKIREVICSRGADGYIDNEEDELKCFILLEADRAVAEWKNTFDLEL